MKTSLWLAVAALSITALVGCSNSKQPSDSNFKAAINSDLTKSGMACIELPQGGRFPIAIPLASLNGDKATVAKLEALQRAGLVKSRDVTEVPVGFFNAGFSPEKPQPVRHYDLTEAGQKDYMQVPSFFAIGKQLCYGNKTVDDIVKWTEPSSIMGATVSDVTYTYGVKVTRDWAQKPDIQAAFPEINITAANADKAQMHAALVLMNKGWEVNH